MKIKDYVEIINITKVYPSETRNFGLAYTFLGLSEETSEFAEKLNEGDVKGMSKELGDCLWYVTAMCQEMNLDAEEVLSEDNLDFTHSSIKSANKILASAIKKYYRDGKELDVELLTQSLKYVVSSYKVIMRTYDLDFNDILKSNYDKLIKRRETNTIHGDGDNREQLISK